MAAMKDLYTTIQEDIQEGKLTFEEIAAKHSVPVQWVDEVARDMSPREWETNQYILDNDYMDDY